MTLWGFWNTVLRYVTENERDIMKHLFLLGLALFLVVPAGFAQDEEAQSDSVLLAGAGIVYRTSVYRGDDSDIYPIPFIYYYNGPFSIRGKSVHYNIYNEDAFSFDVMAQWSFRGYEAGDSAFLAGMADRDMTIEGGISARYQDDWGFIRAQVITDLLSNHDGQEVTLTLGKRFAERRWNLTPSVGVAYLTGNLTDYYYGVRASEAAGPRPAYTANAAWNPFAEIGGTYHINEQWSVMGSVRLDWLDSEISSSPIVDADYQLSINAGLLYRF